MHANPTQTTMCTWLGLPSAPPAREKPSASARLHPLVPEIVFTESDFSSSFVARAEQAIVASAFPEIEFTENDFTEVPSFVERAEQNIDLDFSSLSDID